MSNDLQKEVRHIQLNTLVYSSPFQCHFIFNNGYIIVLKISNLCFNCPITSISSYVGNIGDKYKMWKYW